MPLALKRNRRFRPTLTPLPLQRRRDPFDHRDWVFEFEARRVPGARLRRGRAGSAYLPLTAIPSSASLRSPQAQQGRSLDAADPSLERTAKEIATALQGMSNAILDGEVVCLDGDGCPLFNALLYRRSEPSFVAFDCPWLDGQDLRRLPLIERKRVLRRIIPRGSDCVQYLPHVARRGPLHRGRPARSRRHRREAEARALRARGRLVALGEDQESSIHPGCGPARAVRRVSGRETAHASRVKRE